MKYYLDFGTHKFEGLEEFIVKLNLDNTFNVLCFEPNKTIYDLSKLKTDLLQKYENLFHSFQHKNAAIMDYTGNIVFNSHNGAWKNENQDSYMSDYTTGSNCLDLNPAYDPGNGVIFNIVKTVCDCIDVNEIISNIISNDSNAEIYIKCDIEGSEFVVLPKLLSSPHIKHIKQIYIEWHERFWYGNHEYNTKLIEKQNILNQFNEIGIQTFEHS